MRCNKIFLKLHHKKKNIEIDLFVHVYQVNGIVISKWVFILFHFFPGKKKEKNKTKQNKTHHTCGSQWQ